MSRNIWSLLANWLVAQYSRPVFICSSRATQTIVRMLTCAMNTTSSYNTLVTIWVCIAWVTAFQIFYLPFQCFYSSTVIIIQSSFQIHIVWNSTYVQWPGSTHSPFTQPWQLAVKRIKYMIYKSLCWIIIKKSIC